MKSRGCFAYALVSDEANKDAFVFDTRHFFLGMHQQLALRARWLFQGFRLPVTKDLRRRGLYLPSWAALTEAQIDTVAGAVKGVLE
jgi:dTDP-4-amino-4,6-dideoxygalactose transaminase